MYQYHAKVIHIIDGDTIIVATDLGFKIYATMVFRLYGINTPEIVGEEHIKGLEAKAFLEKLLPEGTEVQIETFKDKKEKYGRFLCTLTLDGVNINDEMVAKGFAIPYFGGKK